MVVYWTIFTVHAITPGWLSCARARVGSQTYIAETRVCAANEIGLKKLRVYFYACGTKSSLSELLNMSTRDYTAIFISIFGCGSYPVMVKSENSKESMSIFSGLMVSVGNGLGSTSS